MINQGNEEFVIEVDGVELTVAIPNGDYTRQELADQLETLINTSPDRAGRSVEIALDNDHLVIKSTSYGADSSIRIVGGTANPPLGLTTGSTANGTNVGGVFRVDIGEGDPVTEKATGNGRLLSGDKDNKYTADLRVRSTLGTSQISGPNDANLTVTRGIGAALDAAIEDLLNSTNGELDSVQDRFNAQLDDLDRNIESVEERIEARRDSLLRQFAALESTLSELQSAGDTITSSLLTLNR